jgi:hypothetical protein
MGIQPRSVPAPINHSCVFPPRVNSCPLEPLPGFGPYLGNAFRGYRDRGTPGYPLKPLRGRRAGTGRFGASPCGFNQSLPGGTMVSKHERGDEPPGLSAPEAMMGRWIGVALVGEIDGNPTSSRPRPYQPFIGFPPTCHITPSGTPTGVLALFGDRVPGAPRCGTPGYPLKPLRGRRAGTGRFGASPCVLDHIQRGGKSLALENVDRHRLLRTTSGLKTTALKGHKRVAGGWSEALPPERRPPKHAEPR